MAVFVPKYYQSFHCIAQDCRHTCCAGWEIDVDPDTMRRYHLQQDDFGLLLQSAIEEDNEGCRFRLQEGDRCPMLRDDGLCDVICHLGEDALCQICADHPRWRNFFPSRTEMGLGMCCEEAVRIILAQEEPCDWILLTQEDEVLPATEDEINFFSMRDQLLTILHDRATPMTERFRQMASVLNIGEVDFNPQEAYGLLEPLERLDSAWDARLYRLHQMEAAGDPAEAFPRLAENLAEYLIIRHFSGGWEDELWQERLAFCLWCTQLVCAVSEDADDFAEAARQFSGEIEYSDENLYALIDFFGGTDGSDTLL